MALKSAVIFSGEEFYALLLHLSDSGDRVSFDFPQGRLWEKHTLYFWRDFIRIQRH